MKTQKSKLKNFVKIFLVGFIAVALLLGCNKKDGKGASLLSGPSDEEIVDALGGISAVYGDALTKMMLGSFEDEHVTIEEDAENQATTFIYKDYPVEKLNEERKAQGLKKELPFTHLNGKVIIKGNMMDGNMDMIYDVTLKGSSVESLYYRIKTDKNDPIFEFKVNGKKYSEEESRELFKTHQENARAFFE